MISWETKERKNTHHSPWWYIIFFALAGLLMLFAILDRSPLTVIVFVLAIALILIFKQRDPEHLKCQIDKEGVTINDYLYPYESLEAFWLTDHDLKIRANKILTPRLTIPLNNNSKSIRAYLVAYIPEVEPEHSLVDSLVEIVGL